MSTTYIRSNDEATSKTACYSCYDAVNSIASAQVCGGNLMTHCLRLPPHFCFPTTLAIEQLTAMESVKGQSFNMDARACFTTACYSCYPANNSIADQQYCGGNLMTHCLRLPPLLLFPSTCLAM